MPGLAANVYHIRLQGVRKALHIPGLIPRSLVGEEAPESTPCRAPDTPKQVPHRSESEGESSKTRASPRPAFGART